jgi:peptidoglycan/LPS O-acetylase OafA/YrhL
MTTTKRPGTVWGLIVLTAIQALGAIPAGIGLVSDPINNIGMPISILEGSPFNDFLIPGLILLVVLGLFPLAVVYGLVRRRQWGWWLSLAVGAGVVIWIVTEVAVLGYLSGAGIGLQIVFGLVGMAILVLALVRPTRRFFRVGRQS